MQQKQRGSNSQREMMQQKQKWSSAREVFYYSFDVLFFGMLKYHKFHHRRPLAHSQK